MKAVRGRRFWVSACFAACVALISLVTAIAFAQDRAAGEHGGGPGSRPHAAGEHGNEAAPVVATENEHGELEHAEHAGGHHGPEPINWTDIWDKKRPAFLALVINFGVLMTLYYMLGKKPITAALKQRRATIGKDIEDAQKLLDEARERAKKYQGDLKNVDADGATAKASLIAAGRGEVDRIIVDAEERAERMKRDAERLVEQERKQVHQDLLNETVNNAVREASQLLEKSATADDHARLAQDLLAELSRRPAAARAGAASSIRPGSGGASSGSAS